MHTRMCEEKEELEEKNDCPLKQFCWNIDCQSLPRNTEETHFSVLTYDIS